MSVVAKYHNATVPGEDLITWTEVRELIKNLKALENQCVPEALSLEDIEAIEAIVVDDPADEPATA